MESSESTHDQQRLDVLPIRVGDGEIPGIPVNSIVPDVRGRTLEQVGNLIVERLRLVLPDLDTMVHVRDSDAMRKYKRLMATASELQLDEQDIRDLRDRINERFVQVVDGQHYGDTISDGAYLRAMMVKRNSTDMLEGPPGDGSKADKGLATSWQGESSATLTVRLLSLVWSYPLTGTTQASWAIKESSVLIGELGSAIEHPGLGVAIVTTELACSAFGAAAAGRVDGCVTWGVAHAEVNAPYRLLAELRDPGTHRLLEIKPDLRHTLAFGVILARARQHYSYVEAYLRLILELQREDGGWPSDSGATTSEMFTAIYALELLHIAESDPTVPIVFRDGILLARERGLIL